MITIEQIKEFVSQGHRVGVAGLTVCNSGNRVITQSEGDYTVLTQEEIDDLETYILGKRTK